MQIYRDINEIPYKEKSHLTIGTFDGIHVGHQKIITEMVQHSKTDGLRSVLVTFFPHPQIVVKNARSPIQLLTPIDEKLEQLRKLNLDAVLIIPFSEELANTDPKFFIEDCLVQRVGVHQFSIGFDHAFGKGRQGNEALLKQIGKSHHFNVHVIPPVAINGETVSSTKIRQFLREGKILKANQFLGREYQLGGTVQKGEKLGEKIGFPTANIHMQDFLKLIPLDGVYAVRVQIGSGNYQGMANIGNKPTVNGKQHGVEVHIHDFSGDIYDQQLTIYFVKRIRDEKHFDSIEALSSQIKEDSNKTRYVLEKNIRR